MVLAIRFIPMKLDDLPCTQQTTSQDETFNLARQFGKLLRPGDLVLLQGPLGAGKTQFTRGVCAGMGLENLWEVDSPTYTVVNHYKAAWGIDHIDLYRFSGEEELEEIGLQDIMESNSVKLIEWPERLSGFHLPQTAFSVKIRIDDTEKRTIDILRCQKE